MKNSSTLPTTKGSPFPVNRIFCVGRNYRDHAEEMGHSRKEDPFFFLKPNSALLPYGRSFQRPAFSNDVHHELELVVALKRGGKKIATKDVASRIFGAGIGLDMTARDIQAQAKALGRPWDISKGFEGSAICSDITPLSLDAIMELPHFQLQRNGVLVQRGHTRNMIWSIPELVSALSHYMALHKGDLIYTGTPAGVGPVTSRDVLYASLEDGRMPLEVLVS